MNIKVHLIGNAHLDPVWLWKKPEGLSEIKSTFRSALDRMNEFDDYCFTSACAGYYNWIEEIDTDMFEEIKSRVKEGRWKIAGGMWIQPDCNLPSGEAFCRQLLYSQRYFLNRFNKIAQTGYNVDSFGHNAMLPQLLSKAGIKNYVFQRPDISEKSSIKKNLFNWVSPDGSSVLTYRIPFGYSSISSKVTAAEEYEGMNYASAKALYLCKLSDTEGTAQLSLYGVGNHGGGPTIETLKDLDKFLKSNKSCKHSGCDEFFEQVRSSDYFAEIPSVYEDLQHHASGCYSANSKIKRMNRNAENALVSAEKYDVLSCVLTGNTTHKSEIEAAWKKVMFNQFHDILAGCSIKEAYKDAYNALGSAADTAEEIKNSALQRISWRIRTTDIYNNVPCEKGENNAAMWTKSGEGAPVVVFNPHSFPVRSYVTLGGYKNNYITDALNNPVNVQIIRGSQTNGDDRFRKLFAVDVPAFGYAVYYAFSSGNKESVYSDKPFADEKEMSLENNSIKVVFDKKSGSIKSIYNKRSKTEYVDSSIARALVFDDSENDTWAHKVFKFDKKTGEFSNAELEVTENGPIRATIRIKTAYKNSVLIQYFSLYENSDSINVYANLRYNEELKIVKLSFPVRIENSTATYSMPYGFIKKSTDGCEEFSHRFCDISDNNGTGVTIINDSKYSFSADKNNLSMIIARSCCYADHYSQELRDDSVSYQDQGEQSFKYIISPHSINNISQTVKDAAVLNQCLEVVEETHHDGNLSTSFCGIDISKSNIIAEVLKKQEDNNGWILRLYETEGQQTDVNIELKLFNISFSASFAPQEIKTFQISDNSIAETNIIENIDI